MEKYNIKTLWDKDGEIEVVTDGGVVVVVTLKLLRLLIPTAFHDKEKKNPVRLPNDAELAMFACMIIDDKLNPYKKECWCYWLKGAYTSVVSSFSRMRKIHLQKDYVGWAWNWIGKDGSRYEQGKKTAPLPDLIGAWADVYRKDRMVWHHELFLCDCPKIGQWNDRRYTMFSKALRDQAHKLAFCDVMGNLSTENEVMFHGNFDTTPDEPVKPKMGSELIDIPDPTIEDASKTTPAPPAVKPAIQQDTVKDAKSGPSDQAPKTITEAINKSGCPF